MQEVPAADCCLQARRRGPGLVQQRAQALPALSPACQTSAAGGLAAAACTALHEDDAVLTLLRVCAESRSVARPTPLEQNERDDTVDDLVKSDFLHEPG